MEGSVTALTSDSFTAVLSANSWLRSSLRAAGTADLFLFYFLLQWRRRCRKSDKTLAVKRIQTALRFALAPPSLYFLLVNKALKAKRSRVV